MCWAWYGRIYWTSGGTQKLHAAKPSACAWNWSLTRNWDYIKIKSIFFSYYMEKNTHSHLKVVCLQCMKKSKTGLQVGKSLFALYLFCNSKHVLPSLNTAHCVWAELHIKEHSFTLQIPPPFPVGTYSIFTISSWLGEGYQEWQRGKGCSGWGLCECMGHAAGAGSSQPKAHVEGWQLTSLCFLLVAGAVWACRQIWESQGTSLELAFVPGLVLRRDAPFHDQTT